MLGHAYTMLFKPMGDNFRIQDDQSICPIRRKESLLVEKQGKNILPTKFEDDMPNISGTILECFYGANFESGIYRQCLMYKRI